MNPRFILVIALTIISLAGQSLSAPPPEKKELTITELAGQLYDFDGKVIEVEVTRGYGLDQIAKGKYTVYLYYRKAYGSSNGEKVLIPVEGKEFIDELCARKYGQDSTETIYIYIHSEDPIRVESGDYTHSFKLEALGTRYRKSKGTYSW
jgi:hypothetical protein